MSIQDTQFHEVCTVHVDIIHLQYCYRTTAHYDHCNLIYSSMYFYFTKSITFKCAITYSYLILHHLTTMAHHINPSCNNTKHQRLHILIVFLSFSTNIKVER